jgi:type II secretory pathway component PulF
LTQPFPGSTFKFESRAPRHGSKLKKNRHPIYYDGVAQSQFQLAPGESFRTAHTHFELNRAENPSAKASSVTWDLLTFTGMTAVLLKGGMSLGKIFQLLHVHHSGEARQFIRDLEHSVLHRAQPFSVALAQHPEIFSEHYVASVELGEMTDLPKTRDRLFRQLTRDFPPLFEGPSEQRLELSSACRNIGELLEGGAFPQRAVEIAYKVCRQEKVKSALLELLEQLRSDTPLADCLFPSLFTDFFPGLIATHDRVGTLPRALLDLADILAIGGPSGER